MQLTPEAEAVWNRFSASDRDSLLSHGFCSRCLEDRPFSLEQGEMRRGELALIGKCSACGARVVRLVIPPA